MTIEEVHATANELLSGRLNNMARIDLKCWVCHSESRIANGNPPFAFKDFKRRLGMANYIDSIKLGLINCDDLGGKESAIEIVRQWYR